MKSAIFASQAKKVAITQFIGKEMGNLGLLEWVPPAYSMGIE